MKTKEQFEQEGFYLRPSECFELKSLIAQLEKIIENKTVNMDMLTVFTNINSEINAMRDKISIRLINLIKQGHKID